MSATCDGETFSASGTGFFVPGFTGVTTCVITNQRIVPVQLTLTKRTVDIDGVAIESDQSFTIIASGGSGSDSAVVDTDPGTITLGTATLQLSAGGVNISEFAPLGWRFEDLECDRGDPRRTSEFAFSLTLDADTNCTVTNRQALVELTIVKETLDQNDVPIEVEERFDFDVQGRTFQFTDLDTSPETVRLASFTFDVTAGVIEISENVPNGWELISVECSNGPAAVVANSVTLEVTQPTTCVFTNRQRPGVDLTLVKQTVDAGGAPVESITVFPFEILGPITQFVELDTSPLTSKNDSETVSIPPGSYRITEVARAGWELIGISCDAATPAIGGNTFTINVSGPLTCTVVNRQISDATITVVKQTLTAGGLLPFESGTAFGFDTSGDTTAEFSLDADTGTATPSSTNLVLPPDQPVTITELPTAGFTLTDVSCVGGSVLVLHDGASAPTGVRVVPERGAVITCTFRNLVDDARLIVIKRTIDGNGATIESGDDFVLNTDVGGVGPATVDTDPASTEPDRLDQLVPPGTYRVTELAPDPWTLVGVQCTTGYTPITGPLGGLSGVEFELLAGQLVVCELRNQQPLGGTATLTVRKVTTESGDSTPIAAPDDFTLHGPGSIGDVVLDTDPLDPTNLDEVTRTLPAATYTLIEDALTGWSLADVSCTGGAATDRFSGPDLEGDVGGGAADTHVLCVFVNERDAVGTGTLTIREEIVLDPTILGFPPKDQFRFAGSGAIGEFVLDADPGSATPEDATFTLPAGTYSVIEELFPSNVRRWDLTDISCSGGETVDITTGQFQPGLLGTTVTLGAGANVVCTFINDGDDLSLVVRKETLDPSGIETHDEQDFSFDLFYEGGLVETILLDTEPIGSPSIDRRFDLLAGHVRIEEAETPGWTLVDIECTFVAAPLFEGDLLIGVEVQVDAVNTGTCEFFNKRNSTGTAVITLEKDTRSSDDFSVPIESSDFFNLALRTTAGEIVVGLLADTSPDTPPPNLATFVVEAGDYALTHLTPFIFNTNWVENVFIDCDGRTSFPEVKFFKDISGDGIFDSGAGITVAPGEEISCRFIQQQVDPPARVNVSKRVVDAQGVRYRYSQSFDYRVIYPENTVPAFADDDFASRDILILQFQGPAGTWAIVEDVPTGWVIDAIECTRRGTGETLSPTPFTDPVSGFVGVTIETLIDDLIDCEVRNRPAPESFLTVIKRTFSLGQEIETGEDFAFQVFPGPGGFGLDTSDQDFDRFSQVFNEFTSPRRMVLPEGLVTLSEFVSQDWDLTSIDCTGSDTLQELRDSTGKLTGMEMTLVAGDDVVCEVRNDFIARTSLTLRKNTLTTAGRLFQAPTVFTITGPDGPFELTSDPDGSVPTERTFTIDAGVPVRFTETQLSGWDLTDITCSIGDVSFVEEGGAIVGMDISVAENEFANCSFTNTSDLGRVTVEKRTFDGVDEVTTTDSFTIRGDVGPFVLDTDALSSTPSEDSVLRSDGAVTVLEDPTDGWVFDRVECTERSARADFSVSAASDGVAQGVSFQLEPGDQVRCVFFNNTVVTTGADLSVTKFDDVDPIARRQHAHLHGDRLQRRSRGRDQRGGHGHAAGGRQLRLDERLRRRPERGRELLAGRHRLGRIGAVHDHGDGGCRDLGHDHEQRQHLLGYV